MPGRKKRKNKITLIVALLVGFVAGFSVLSTVQERTGHDFGLPQLRVPSLVAAFSSVGDIPLRQEAPPIVIPEEATLSVHFIDVGQGESILIIAPEKTVLIDGGDNGQGGNVLRYLNAQGVSAIDILIATHPHADHIGGLTDVVGRIPITEVLLPELPDAIVPTTRTYTNFLLALLDKGLAITPAAFGDVYNLGGGATLTILAPLRDYSSLNNMGIVSRLEFGSTSFLFTGDIEIAAESDLAARGGVRSNVLNIAHHGSRTSSTQVFLDSVMPNIAVISCGMDNSFGHPHRTVMERLQAMDIRILRTDLDGNIVLISDGESIGIVTER